MGGAPDASMVVCRHGNGAGTTRPSLAALRGARCHDLRPLPGWSSRSWRTSGAGSPAGQSLARLESTDQAIALAQAEEKLANTKQSVERQRALKAAGVVTEADSERVEFEHREATLRLRQAQRDLELTRIVAPFTGVVTERKARLHRLVSAGDTLFRLTGAAARSRGRAGARGYGGAPAHRSGCGGRRAMVAATAQARIIRASPMIDAASGTREIILQLTAGHRLIPGSSVTVRLGSERTAA